MDQKSAGLKVSIFFCQQLDPDQDKNRRALEKEMGDRIRFFPLPCSGRIDSLHLMHAFDHCRIDRVGNEVMHEVGYSDAKAFREVFRKHTGLSPIEYRKRYNAV